MRNFDITIMHRGNGAKRHQVVRRKNRGRPFLFVQQRLNRFARLLDGHSDNSYAGLNLAFPHGSFESGNTLLRIPKSWDVRGKYDVPVPERKQVFGALIGSIEVVRGNAGKTVFGRNAISNDAGQAGSDL